MGDGHMIRKPRSGVFAFAAAAAVLVGSLAACGTNGSPNSSPNSFTFWSTWSRGEPQQVVEQQAIDAFTKATGITVNVQWEGRQVGTKVKVANNTSNVPDLVDDTGEDLLGGFDAGIYRGLNSVYSEKVPGTNETVADVVPAKVVAPYKAKGQYVIAPFETYATSLWFDDREMQKIGATPPATFDQFLATCKKAVAAGIACVADDGTVPDYSSYWLAYLTLRYMGTDWLRTAAADKTGQAFENPKFIAAAKDLQAMVQGKGYMLSGYQGSKLPAGQQAWAQDKALYLLMGSWAPSDTSGSAASGFEYDSVPFPGVSGGNMDTDSNAIGFGITAKAKNPSAAGKFVAYFMQHNYLAKVVTQADSLSPVTTGMPAPQHLESVQKQLATAPATDRYLDGTQGTYPDWWTNVFDVADNSLFFGQVNAQQFVTKLVSLSKSYWASH